MAKYAWCIMGEFDDDDPSGSGVRAVCISGPSDATPILSLQAKTGRGAGASFFELRNGDGERCAQGFIAGEFSGFEPLDDYGEGSYGATEIWYQNDSGTWEEL